MNSNLKNNKNFNLPNKLTAFRLLCIPLVIFFLSFHGKILSFFAAFFIGMAFITDILDGYFARKYGEITALGKFLDPLADKILVTVSMIMLIPLERIPILIVLIIIAREIAITGLRGIAVNEGIVIQASKLGKYKTIFQAVAILGLALHYEYFNVDFHVVGMIFLWAALILTIWSGWDYFKQFTNLFSPEKRGDE
jgi:CDP-diacylglycerol--glycerol-3-phosphate 3-phosphatidyltransferase